MSQTTRSGTDWYSLIMTPKWKPKPWSWRYSDCLLWTVTLTRMKRLYSFMDQAAALSSLMRYRADIIWKNFDMVLIISAKPARQMEPFLNPLDLFMYPSGWEPKENIEKRGGLWKKGWLSKPSVYHIPHYFASWSKSLQFKAPFWCLLVNMSPMVSRATPLCLTKPENIFSTEGKVPFFFLLLWQKYHPGPTKQLLLHHPC